MNSPAGFGGSPIAADDTFLFFDHAPEALLLLGAGRQILRVNAAATGLFAAAPESLCQLDVAALAGADAGAMIHCLDAASEAGRANTVLSLRRVSGAPLRARIAASALPAGGAEVHWLLSVCPLAEVEPAEVTMAPQDAVLRAVVDSVDDYIFAVDAERYEITWSNRAFREYLRRERGIELGPGMDAQRLNQDAPDRVALWQALFRRTLAEGSCSVEHRTPGGRALMVNLNTIREGGRVTGIAVVGRDVSERTDAQRRIAESEERYRGLFNAMAEGVVVQAADGRIVSVNPAAERIQGRSAAQMMGLTSDAEEWQAVREDGSPFPGEEHPAMVTLRTGLPQSEVVMGLSRPDGEQRWISINSQPLRLPDDAAPRAVLTTFHDITERRRSEAAIARHLQQIERSMRQSLQAVATMVELRDPYTAGHERRVGEIARDIGRALGWDERRCEAVQLAGLVHDIGKIAVPAEILVKPSRLSPVEFSLVRGHAERGYEILRDIEFPWPLAEMVRQHHERMDGSGYPQGLSGEQILPEARVLAVADVIESMASHRPYRPALGLAEALRELRRGRGSIYDAAIVDCVIDLIERQGWSLPD